MTMNNKFRVHKCFLSHFEEESVPLKSKKKASRNTPFRNAFENRRKSRCRTRDESFLFQKMKIKTERKLGNSVKKNDGRDAESHTCRRIWRARFQNEKKNTKKKFNEPVP